MTTIYCDESGFAGNNLWQNDQPYFVYSAVKINEADAKTLILEAKKKFQINAPELHTGKLMKNDRGRRAVEWLLLQVSDHTRITCFQKRFCLAAKMFEYLIEPMLSEKSKLFYDSGFHRFVANLLYFKLIAHPNIVESSFLRFQELMRELDGSLVGEFVNNIDLSDGDESILDLVTVLTCNQKAISRELNNCRNSVGNSNWILELSLTALRTILTHYSGKEMVPLNVICDNSKPLLAQAGHLNAAGIGRQDYQSIEIDGRECPITFCLESDVTFGNSATLYGLQIADVAASSASYALRFPSESFSNTWLNLFSTALLECVEPDAVELDLTTSRAARNAMILSELARRSAVSQCLLSGIEERIALAYGAANSFAASS